MQQDKDQQNMFLIPFRFSCFGIREVTGKNYQDALNKLEAEINQFNINQNHLTVRTLEDNEYDVAIEDYNLDYEQKDLSHQMDSAI